MNVVIVDADYRDLALETRLFAEAGMDLRIEACRTEDDVLEAARGAHAILVQYAPITRRVLGGLPELRIVSRYGVGVDTVDLLAAQELGVWVANVPDYGVEEVSVHALGMCLSLVRHLPGLARDVRRGVWHFSSTGPLRRPSTLTIGVAGLGRIGGRVAGLAQGIYGTVLGFDPDPHATARGATLVADLEELFARSHVVTLHLPLLPETREVVNGSLFGRMPRGSYLVNTSRGGLVHEGDLLDALDDGSLAGAALDVVHDEPPEADNPLVRHERVLVTPHAAFYSVESEEELRRKAVRNVIDCLRSGRPEYPVVTPADLRAPRTS